VKFYVYEHTNLDLILQSECFQISSVGAIKV
jgi:hypothetical protein